MSTLTRDDFVGLAVPAGHNDFDGNGRSDVLWRHDDGSLVIWRLNAQGTFASQKLAATPEAQWRIAETGNDFNADGHSDIVWRHADGSVVVWALDGNGGFQSATLASRDSAWSLAETGDFNGDERSDFLWRHTDGTVEAWITGASAGVPVPILGNQGTDRQVAGAGDINGDGCDDILWRLDDGSVEALLMHRDGSFAPQDLGSRDAGWTILAVGDFNGDGRDDILWRQTVGAAPAVEAWLMDGAGGHATQALGTPESYWQVEDVADFNADGIDDLLWRNQQDGEMSIWHLNGVGSFSGGLVNIAPELAWHIQNDPTVLV